MTQKKNKQVRKLNMDSYIHIDETEDSIMYNSEGTQKELARMLAAFVSDMEDRGMMKTGIFFDELVKAYEERVQEGGDK